MNAKGLLQNRYVRMLRDAVTAWWNDQAPSKGAALAYYSMFSIAPLLYLIISIAGLFFGPDAVRGMVFDVLSTSQFVSVIVILYFVAINGYSTAALIRGARQTSGVVRQRLRFAAAGSGGCAAGGARECRGKHVGVSKKPPPEWFFRGPRKTAQRRAEADQLGPQRRYSPDQRADFNQPNTRRIYTHAYRSHGVGLVSSRPSRLRGECRAGLSPRRTRRKREGLFS